MKFHHLMMLAFATISFAFASSCDEADGPAAFDSASMLVLQLSDTDVCPDELAVCKEWCLVDPATGNEYPTGISCCIPAELSQGDITTNPEAFEACMANIRGQ